MTSVGLVNSKKKKKKGLGKRVSFLWNFGAGWGRGGRGNRRPFEERNGGTNGEKKNRYYVLFSFYVKSWGWMSGSAVLFSFLSVTSTTLFVSALHQIKGNRRHTFKIYTLVLGNHQGCAKSAVNW